MSAILEEITGKGSELDFFSPAAPAAGANYSFTVGSKNVKALRLVSVIATLTTDANAANRFFAVDYITSRSTTVLRSAPTVLITASTSATVFQWDTAHTVSEWNTGTMVFAPLANPWLTPGWTVQLTVDNKQVGDTITAITFCTENVYADS